MKSIFDFISKKSLSITLFESASAGYLAYRISQDKNSGILLDGSIVSYDLLFKKRILNIKQSLIKKYTAESQQVTTQLIVNGKKLFKSDIYISCTGLLKRGGSENKYKPVGTFFYCIYFKKDFYNFKITTKGKPTKKLKILYKAIMKSLSKILKNYYC
ncbi:CinA family protein [Acinetobacter sp. YH16042]|uniref:CinA family protein n=1 Tax=Acinetobacter sp. YH16042 TaxID=2601186 RepID=UPI0015D0DEEF|nr:CinA family protein [Acinetobacter sp. YH16042]